MAWRAEAEAEAEGPPLDPCCQLTVLQSHFPCRWNEGAEGFDALDPCLRDDPCPCRGRIGPCHNLYRDAYHDTYAYLDLDSYRDLYDGPYCDPCLVLCPYLDAYPCFYRGLYLCPDDLLDRDSDCDPYASSPLARASP